MSGNGLTSLPPPYAWKSLGVREIRYTGNKLTKIDLTDCKRFWSRLESLYVGQNHLKEVIIIIIVECCISSFNFTVIGLGAKGNWSTAIFNMS